jgi:hypothetical protein
MRPHIQDSMHTHLGPALPCIIISRCTRATMLQSLCSSSSCTRPQNTTNPFFAQHSVRCDSVFLSRCCHQAHHAHQIHPTGQPRFPKQSQYSCVQQNYRPTFTASSGDCNMTHHTAAALETNNSNQQGHHNLPVAVALRISQHSVCASQPL